MGGVTIAAEWWSPDNPVSQGQVDAAFNTTLLMMEKA